MHTKPKGTFKVLSHNINLQIVHILTLINIKRSLIRFICYSISYPWPKHHLVTAHIVIQHIFKLWHEGVFVYDVEINYAFCCYLNSNIAFDVKNEATDFDGVEKLPLFFFGHVINDLFKEIDVARASDDQTFATKHYHLPKIFINNLLHCKLIRFIWVHKKCLPLSVKRVNHVSCLTVEAVVWEVGSRAIHSYFATLAQNSSLS